jgi:hypothetical protein
MGVVHMISIADVLCGSPAFSITLRGVQSVGNCWFHSNLLTGTLSLLVTVIPIKSWIGAEHTEVFSIPIDENPED